MISLQLFPELWRLTLLICILILYKSAYRLVPRIMDRIISSPSKSTTTISHSKSQNADSNPTGPNLSSFHRRFRSSVTNSTSENTLDLTDTAPPAKSEAAKAAKRFLLSIVRDDWSYPPLERSIEKDLVHREPVDYRAREDGSSDPEPLSDEPYDARDPMVFTESDPYKFENPDAVARTISDKKRKRRKMFDEELHWNKGLRTWVARRNAWCGAVRQRPTRRPDRSETLDVSGHASVASDPDLLLPRSRHSHASATSSSPVDSGPESGSDEEIESPEDNQDALLPVYPSLLPEENSIRASIKPTMYPAIYSKVVLQSLTPTVPVPLPDMIGCLVHGWKSEGNWPPKGGAPSTSFIQEGGRRASELLKFRRRESAVAEKGRVRKGVGAVKKALGLRTSTGETSGSGLNFEETLNQHNNNFTQASLAPGVDPSPI